MRAYSLRTKLLVLLVGLIGATQLITTLSVLSATRRNAEETAFSELNAAARVFRRVLEERERQLVSSVGILASDSSFKRAVARREWPTVEGVLDRHAGRVRADVTVLLDLRGAVAAVVAGDKTELASVDLEPLVARARSEGGAAGLVPIGGRPHQVVVAPVKAPLTLAWVCMGFELDAALARELRDVSGVEVTFAGPGGFAGAAPASTLGADAAASVAAALERAPRVLRDGIPGRLPGTDWIALPIELDTIAAAPARVLLQTSWARAMIGYDELRNELVTDFGIGLAFALAAVLFTTHTLTGSLAALARSAERIAHGDYGAPLDVRSHDEIGVLAETFRTMQRALGEREAEIVRRAAHDPLTELPHRGVVNDGIDALLASAKRDDEGLLIVVLDVDRLKDINQSLGQPIGDLALRAVADRLRSEEIAAAFVARIDGDGFLAVLPGAQDAETRVERLVDTLRVPIRTGGASLRLSCTAGIARYPDDGDASDELLRRAELALAEAKRAHLTTAIYRDGAEEEHRRRVAILSDLERAIADDALELEFQPKLDVATQRVGAVEVLVRWNHPEFGAVDPDEFIGLAEQAGTVRSLTDRVLYLAIEQCGAWSRSGLELKVDVNLSALDVSDPALPRYVQGLLETHGVPAERLGVEVTESAVMADPRQGARVLQALRDAGVSVAIDDFGTGHSSLAQLRALPADELKIDKAFVLRLAEGTSDELIVRSSIALAHAFGMRCVAEGVEDRRGWALLERLGCDAVQGFWVSGPLSAEALPARLEALAKHGPGSVPGAAARDDDDTAPGA